MQSEININENFKRKLFSFLINIFLIFGLFIFPESDSMLNMPAWMNQLDIFITALFVIPLSFQFLMLFKNTGLTLNSNGINENMSRLKKQNFSWSEITGIRFVKIYFWKYILIFIRDPQSYLNKQNFYRKFMMGFDYKKLGTPVKIPIHAIEQSPEEISKIISDYAKNLKGVK